MRRPVILILAFTFGVVISEELKKNNTFEIKPFIEILPLPNPEELLTELEFVKNSKQENEIPLINMQFAGMKYLKMKEWMNTLNDSCPTPNLRFQLGENGLAEKVVRPFRRYSKALQSYVAAKYVENISSLRLRQSSIAVNAYEGILEMLTLVKDACESGNVSKLISRDELIEEYLAFEELNEARLDVELTVDQSPWYCCTEKDSILIFQNVGMEMSKNNFNLKAGDISLKVYLLGSGLLVICFLILCLCMSIIITTMALAKQKEAMI